jgi:hypothetical protein
VYLSNDGFFYSTIHGQQDHNFTNAILKESYMDVTICN